MKPRLLLTLGAIAALPIAWIAAGRMHRFAYWIGRHSLAEVEALATGGWTVDRLVVDDGVELVGLVRKPRAADARWILFVPGNSSWLLAGFRDVLDGLRGDDDVGLAVWAYRGFDASGGSPSPAALRQDLSAQWARLRELGAVPERTEIWGYSLGSMLAPHLAAELCDAGTPPRRLVLLATGLEIPVRPFGTFGRFRRSDVYECASVADRVTCPVAIGHGTEDDALPLEGARELARRFGVPLHEFHGYGHANLWPAAKVLY